MRYVLYSSKIYTMSSEKWKPIPFIDTKMEASTLGRIRDGVTKNLIQVYRRKSGYEQFFAFVNGKLKTTYVHRCVLSAHGAVNGYENLDVHHKDHNPSNNKLINLVWCTPRENALYSLADGRMELSKKAASESAKSRIKDGTHPFFNLTEDQHKSKYITRSLNYKIKGNHPNKGKVGLKGTNCKLTMELIMQIRDRHKKGEYAVRIAKSLNLSRQTIDNVIHNKKNYT